MTSATEPSRPLPHPSELTQPFWDATKEGRMVIQQCSTCKSFVWTPQMACRKCLTPTLEWTEVSGKGTVYTYVVLHKAAHPAFTAPYAIAVVELDEGPKFFTDLVEVNVDDIAIGMPVEVAFEDAGPVALPHFRPRK